MKKKATRACRKQEPFVGDCVEIDVAPGTRVRWAFPQNGLRCHQDTAKLHLSRRKTYTVERTDIHGWHTDLYLREVPGVAFNHVLFGIANKGSSGGEAVR